MHKKIVQHVLIATVPFQSIRRDPFYHVGSKIYFPGSLWPLAAQILTEVTHKFIKSHSLLKFLWCHSSWWWVSKCRIHQMCYNHSNCDFQQRPLWCMTLTTFQPSHDAWLPLNLKWYSIRPHFSALLAIRNIYLFDLIYYIPSPGSSPSQAQPSPSPPTGLGSASPQAQAHKSPAQAQAFGHGM